QFNWYWTDWKITDISWEATYEIDNNIILDIYIFHFNTKLAPEIDVDTLPDWFWAGPMTDKGDGWYEFDYGQVAYNRNNGECFSIGGNDSFVGTYVFHDDLIRWYKEQ
ncbi:MAG: hypothetical protein ACI4TB_00345, partial [Lachnospiraceae bacterium]